MTAHPPEHSGEAISILKVQPYSDRGIVLTSDGVGPDGWIDPRHAAEGDNLSPPLSWNEVEGAGAYALIVEDPDAPREKPFVHWVAWNIPGQYTALPEGVPNQGWLESPQNMVQGRNDMHEPGWFGPRPPAGHGMHRYHFQLFALDGPLELGPEADLTTLLNAIKGRTIADGELVGTYETPAEPT
jgi:Raf kinase inhibitor-like YbhB/YbcL family protein